MRIRTKIYYGYGVIIGVLMVTMFANVYTKKRIFEDLKKANSLAKTTGDLNSLAISVLQLLMPANDYLITGDPVEFKKYNILYEDTIRRLSTNKANLDKHNHISKILEKNVAKINKLSHQIFLLKNPNRGSRSASDLMYKMDQVGNQTYILIKAHNKMHQKELEDFIRESSKNEKYINLMLIFTLILIFIFGLAIINFFNKYIQKPIEKLSSGFQGVSHGRWNQVQLDQNDELSDLAKEFNAMIERMGSSYEDLEKEVRARTRELNDLNKRLEIMSRTDGLTGLFNQRYFFERYAHEYERVLRYNRPLSVFMIDIDFFKQYNDNNGHPAGDKVIIGVSKIIAQKSRKIDLVARYGGEEFVIVAPEMDKKEAWSFAERLRLAVQKEKFFNEKKQPGGKITISIGVAVFPDVNSSAENLLQKADDALYAAKRDGRNLSILYSNFKKERKVAKKAGPKKTPKK